MKCGNSGGRDRKPGGKGGSTAGIVLGQVAAAIPNRESKARAAVAGIVLEITTVRLSNSHNRRKLLVIQRLN